MKPADASLYICCDDLAARVLSEVRRWPDRAVELLGARLCAAALDLLVEVSVALSFPDARRQSLAAADMALTRLRVLVRLAERPPPLLDDATRAELVDALARVGRMVGGWRRRVEGRPAGERRRSSG